MLSLLEQRHYMWAIVLLFVNVICIKVDGRYINKLNKEKKTSGEDKEFEKLEKRQQITGELEINGQRFESLGCWRDAWARGLPTIEGEHYLLMDPNYKGRRHALYKCARAALDKGRKIFGIENGGQCFASSVGDNEYRRYGASKDCRGDGKGGPWSLQVYRFVDPKKSVNGEYSPWSSWTECSKSCGGGVRRRMRKCSNPPPSNGGKDCRNLGPSIESQDCNVKVCKVSGNFGLGTPEFHISKPSYQNGNQAGRHVRQFAGPSGQISSKERQNAFRGEQEEQTHHVQQIEQYPNQDQGNNFNLHSSLKKAEKYVPISREDFKKIASFQKSVSTSSQYPTNGKGKYSNESPSVPRKSVSFEVNTPKQPMRLSSNPKAQRNMEEHNVNLYEGSKPFDADNSNKEKFSNGAASSRLNNPSMNHVGPAADDFLIPKLKTPLTNEHYDDKDQKRPAILETDKMNAAESSRNSKGFSLVGQSLETMKTDTSSDNLVSPHDKHYFDHLHDSAKESGKLENKPSGYHVTTELKNSKETEAHNTQQQDTEIKQRKPTRFKENLQNEKGKEMHQSLSALPKKRPMESGFTSMSSKDTDMSPHRKLSSKEKQAFGQKERATEPTSSKLQGAYVEHGERAEGPVGDSHHVSTTGDALSMTKEKASFGIDSQRAEKNPKSLHDVGTTLHEKYPPQEELSSKPFASSKGQTLQSNGGGERNEKQESDQEQSSYEGEPVPMVDLNKGASMGGMDYGPANGEESLSPGVDSTMQNHEGGTGEDYGPENEESPIADASQQSRPVFDNEAIQGITDLSQGEDARIIQQANSEGQAGPDGGMGFAYEDSSMPQAYTGETSKEQVQEEVEKNRGEAAMNQRHSSSGLENKEQSQEKIETSLTSNDYTSEPAEDCLCPKKECSAKADVAFLVDGSGNIPQPYYARVLEFIKIFSRGFDKRNTHIGLMAFGDDVKTALDLKGLSDFRQFDDAVNIAPYIGGKAYTGNALLQMKTNLFAISGRQDAPRALILLSSGGSADDVIAPAEELRDTGVKVTAIGLGKQANVRELINIASEPKSEHVFTAFLDTLPNAMDDIIQEVCRDVMGIVRDRQVPCTCETNNGQVGRSSNYMKDTSETGAVPTDSNHHYERYSQKDKESETDKRPLSQEEPITEGFQSTGGPGIADQQARPAGGNSERQAEMTSSGLHPSKISSSNDQENQNPLVSSGELSQDEEALHSQTLLSPPLENKNGAVDETSKVSSTNSDENRGFQSHQRMESVQDSQNNGTLGPLRDAGEQPFAAGVKENYQSQDKDDSGIAQPFNQSQALHGFHGSPGDSFKTTALNTERVQGTSLRLRPGTEALSNEDISSKAFERPNYPEGYSNEKYEPSPEYKVPSKIMAVGKAAENFKAEGEKQNSHDCGKVHLGVVLDSSSSPEGRGTQQAAKMMDLLKRVSHLFPASPQGNSVGMVVYGGSPQPSVVHFDKFLDQESMDQAIDNASIPNLEIRIGKALTVAQKQLFSQPATSKHKALLLVTDGFSSDNVSRPAIELKRRGIEVFCLGVGNNVNQTQLDIIASEPKNSHVFLAPFNDAAVFMGRIQKEICQSARRAGEEPNIPKRRGNLYHFLAEVAH
ncbi:uncharacterized protein LOC111340522 isoform X2 [Stylophora pistillata]|uniref:uncharacterized protein LOC111340522 isoform X2 n=1 Tax=Stylophora pistillata TaxID=50429 RepID=UPI000C04F244|nr:uncharacterized protein LOC111340522 isoform X2 [Stylophora pistillata]